MRITGITANRHTGQADERLPAFAGEISARQVSPCLHAPFYPAPAQRKSRIPQTLRFTFSLPALPLSPADIPAPIRRQPARLSALSPCPPSRLPCTPIHFPQVSAGSARSTPAQPINVTPTSTTLSLDMTAEEAGVTTFTAPHEMRQRTPGKHRRARSQALRCLRFFR